MAFEQQVNEYNMHNDTKVYFLTSINGEYILSRNSFVVSQTNGDLVCQFVKSAWFNRLFNSDGVQENFDFMVVGSSPAIDMDDIQQYVSDKSFEKFKFHYHFNMSRGVLKEASKVIVRQRIETGLPVKVVSNEDERISLDFKARVIDNVADSVSDENPGQRVLLSNPCFVIPKDSF